MTDLKLAFVYGRVSTDDQTELSPDSQLEAIRSWAEKNGYVIPGIDEFISSHGVGGNDYIFFDEGISGRSAKKRPRFNDMIARAKDKSHPVDAILLWKFSRFARNQEESIVYKAMLRKAGVEVISISEPIVDGPFGSLIERIIEWMDEYYSIRLSGEVKRSMSVNAERGVRQTAPPFGYRLNRAEDGPFMVPDEAEVPVIREVFADYVNGVPVWQIVDKLNARGVVTHRGGAIENRTIMYWLQNPVYVGKNRWTPTGRTRRDFHNPDTVTVAGDHEPLVTQEEFDAAQKLVREASEKYRPKARPSFELKDWMGGIVRCADCGCTLVFQRPRYFVCNGYVHARCKSRQSITVDALHDAVLERLHADLASSAPLSYKVSQSDSSVHDLKILRQQAEQYEKKLSRIRDAYAAGVDSLEEYRRFKEEIDCQQSEITARIEELEAKVDPAAAARQLRESIAATLRTLEAPDVSLTEKNSAVRSLFDSCTYNKAASTLAISYRLFI
ncbi:MAG: recombinase family protein [Synergistaceae bacterium]|nr:recombinase family protein [Synergistaceae bacterium]